jgi:fibronectin-binding autotransporter adhesin
MGLNTVPAVAGLTYKVNHLTSSSTWTAPSNVSMVDILMIGGGQGGSGFTASNTASSQNYGGGGGPGAIVYVKDFPVVSGTSYSYTIGAGGAGGVASGTTSTQFPGSPGGTTTFSTLQAPGGKVRLGTVGVAVSTQSRGGWGIFFGASGETITNTTAVSQSSWNSTYAPSLYGFPESFNSIVYYTDFNAGGSGSAISSVYPSHFPSGNNSTYYIGELNIMGIGKGFSRLLSDLTAPQGATTSTYGTGRTLGANPAGWGGFGTASTNDPTGLYAGYGAGASAVGQYQVAGSVAGGAAAANSGSGGGSASVANPSTGFSVKTANGGAGGSGVIVIGYWG